MSFARLAPPVKVPITPRIVLKNPRQCPECGGTRVWLPSPSEEFRYHGGYEPHCVRCDPVPTVYRFCVPEGNPLLTPA